MKRTALIILSVIMLICGCTASPERSKSEERIYDDGKYLTGIWMTFTEIKTMFLSGDFRSAFDAAAENLKTAKITDLYFHVRAFCDSVFPSEYFPTAVYAQNLDYDPFKYVIEKCHSENIRVHAWINPYRVKKNITDIEALNHNSPAYIWLKDENADNDRNVIICSEGIYLNPASAEARALVLNGIREILNNYAVDGIHFDDYFYPSTDEAIDATDYAEYLESAKSPLALDDYRRANVNALISGVYTAVKFVNKKIVFSISPAASIDGNYNKLYADIGSWIKSGCIDMIIPQLYFGFDYPDSNYRFKKLLSDWKAVSEKGNARLIIGLACYKTGTETEPDCKEWKDGADIISKQVKICKNDSLVRGHIYFSYSYLFSEEEILKKSREYILES